jgi:hypothetical protein
MIKTFLSYFVLFLFSLYTLSSPIIWASYFAYQEYIAATFCVNKELPLCNGKCYINTIVEEKPTPTLPKIEVRTPELVSFTIDKFNLHTIDNHTLLLFSTLHQGDVSSGFTLELIQPPEHNPVS